MGSYSRVGQSNEVVIEELEVGNVARKVEMTRYKESKEVLYKTNEVVRVTCDRCEKDIPLDIETPTFSKRRKACVEVSDKESYPPEGGYYTDGWQVQDICDECAEFLKNLLEKNGFKISEFEE